MKLEKLKLIAEKAKENRQMKFTSLIHHIRLPLLEICFQELDKNKACGIDGMTKEAYGENLEENLKDLIQRLKDETYSPNPVKQVEIPKPGKKEKRKVSISCLEDKLIQMAVKKILEPLYEPLFLNSSHGYRPKRSCHTAIKALHHQIMKTKTNYIVEVDIKGFFDHVQHYWMLRCLEERISDPKFLWLLRILLKAGIMEEGQVVSSQVGTPQGSAISPLLANIYLHYVVDLWFEMDFKVSCQGHCEQVRYCDDFVVCFSKHEDARRYLAELQIRLNQFGLEISPEKTRIVKFGRKAWSEFKEQGNKPDSFEFLGLTHCLGQGQSGYFKCILKTSKGKFRDGLKNIQIWLKNIICRQSKKVWWSNLCARVRGHFNYFGISGNFKSLQNFLYQITRMTLKLLNRRSQKKSMNWEQFNEYLKWYPLPKPRIIHKLY